MDRQAIDYVFVTAFCNIEFLVTLCVLELRLIYMEAKFQKRLTSARGKNSFSQDIIVLHHSTVCKDKEYSYY